MFDERRVHAFEVSEPSESASCALVLEARCNENFGVEVPMPSATRLLSKKNELKPLSAVPFANCTAPVPPTADEPPLVVRHVLLIEKQPPVRSMPPVE